MANESTTVVLRGKVNFFRMLPHQLKLNYDKSGKEWTTDFYDFPVKEIKALGIGDRVKQKDEYLDGAPYMTFKQKELRADGQPNRPVVVTDILGNSWDLDKELGNGTTVDAKFAVVDYGKGKKKGVYLRSIRVLDHVEFNRGPDFDPISETDEFFEAAIEAQKKAVSKPKTILEALDEEDDNSPWDEDGGDEMPM